MKKIFLVPMLFLLFSVGARGQGTDVIFWIDNSTSITDAEFAEMRNSVQAVMANVLACNQSNRVTVVQYDMINTYIESQFQNTQVVFQRRYFIGGNAFRSLMAINDALNGTPNIDIMGQANLTFTPGNARVVYFFTDAERNFDLTVPAVPDNSQSFLAYTNFKNTWNAKFIVTMVPLTQLDNNAGAAISSLGGNYFGAIEAYPNDPDGPGQLPRYFLSKTNFNLSPAEINLVTQDICSITSPPCVASITRLPIINDVSVQDNQEASDNITASNTINNGAIAIYHAGNNVALMPGFHSASGSRLRAYIEACTGDFQGKIEKTASVAASENDSAITVYPNPASDNLNIESSSAISNIEISTMEGMIVFRNDYKKGQRSVQINISSFKNGLYILNVKDEDGKTASKKIAKR